jgi:xylan 1,4-beta-xylosidase
LNEAFTRHLEERYGKDEVESWYFEVWNEPNIDFWNGVPKKETYFALYDTTAKAVKSVDAKLRVGGPATAQAAWVDDFIAHCVSGHIPFDFVSTHVYGNENPDLLRRV